MSLNHTLFFQYGILLLALASYALDVACQPRVKIGNEVLIEKHLSLLKDKRVGLITNHTGRLSSGEFLLDVLKNKGVNVVALFGPEHGLRGSADAGEILPDMKDEKTGIPIISLYGKTRKPTQENLENIDLLIYDIQDVGVRFYTYISTMGLCMEAAAEKGIPFIVVDRPNPLGGLKVDGPILDDSLKSFVGMYPIPVVYGLTCGELATMINEEGWFSPTAGSAQRKRCDLTIIRMVGWKRSMTWDETGLTWIPPSPNIKTFEAALAYPATCLIEATNISEGRGTDKPFQLIGAPFMFDPQMKIVDRLPTAMNGLNLKGLRFAPAAFTPTSSKFKGETCRGIFIDVTNWDLIQPVTVNLHLLNQLQRLYPSEFQIRVSSLLRLLGSGETYRQFKKGTGIEQIAITWRARVKKFESLRAKYLIYKP
jgi:uncharacterized protein YbbC (DUF1343 family)